VERGRGRSKVFRRVCFEFLHAGGAAEVVGFPAVLVSVFGRRGIHIHPADWVAFEGGI